MGGMLATAIKVFDLSGLTNAANGDRSSAAARVSGTPLRGSLIGRLRPSFSAENDEANTKC